MTTKLSLTQRVEKLEKILEVKEEFTTFNELMKDRSKLVEELSLYEQRVYWLREALGKTSRILEDLVDEEDIRDFSLEALKEDSEMAKEFYKGKK